MRQSVRRLLPVILGTRDAPPAKAPPTTTSAQIARTWRIPAPDPDLALRQSAIHAIDVLARTFDDLVPLSVLRRGFEHDDRRISFGSFQKGIHRAKEQGGPAALSLLTAAPRAGRPAPYDDVFDVEDQVVIYHYRSGAIDQPDNRALRAAHASQAPLIYFRGISPGQYHPIAPVFVTEDDPDAGLVMLEVGLRHADVQGEGIVSSEVARRYRFTEVRQRYHQARFRRDVLHAYRYRCAICALREPELVEASHIIRDPDPAGIAAVVNGLALCAIHHLAYDRNLLGIDPGGIVHIGLRLLKEQDGPMLRGGIQSFHGTEIHQPARFQDRPDPERLGVRFDEFEQAA